MLNGEDDDGTAAELRAKQESAAGSPGDWLLGSARSGSQPRRRSRRTTSASPCAWRWTTITASSPASTCCPRSRRSAWTTRSSSGFRRVPSWTGPRASSRTSAPASARPRARRRIHPEVPRMAWRPSEMITVRTATLSCSSSPRRVLLTSASTSAQVNRHRQTVGGWTPTEDGDYVDYRARENLRDDAGLHGLLPRGMDPRRLGAVRSSSPTATSFGTRRSSPTRAPGTRSSIWSGTSRSWRTG